MLEIDGMCKKLEKVKADLHANGKGYHSKAELDEYLLLGREIQRCIDIATEMDILGMGRTGLELD